MHVEPEGPGCNRHVDKLRTSFSKHRKLHVITNGRDQTKKKKMQKQSNESVTEQSTKLQKLRGIERLGESGC